MFSVFVHESLATLYDVLPIILLLGFFQVVVLRRPLAQPRRLFLGLFYVALGLTLFRIGLIESLIPIGDEMARQLAAPAVGTDALLAWFPVLAFAGLIGFSATLIEPTLIATARRVEDLSGGALRPLPLRLVVSLGVALGLLLGAARIVYGIPLVHLVIVLVLLLAILGLTAPRPIVPLALDIGGVATSVVTVPLIAAFGIAMADTIPGRTMLHDGFGLIVLALLTPPVILLAFVQAQAGYRKRKEQGGKDAV
jgi:hypothetical protein